MSGAALWSWVLLMRLSVLGFLPPPPTLIQWVKLQLYCVFSLQMCVPGALGLCDAN